MNKTSIGSYEFVTPPAWFSIMTTTIGVVLFTWFKKLNVAQNGSVSESDDESDNPPRPYYLEELRKLKFVELSEEELNALSENYMEHSLENGSKVIMSYCHEKSCFVYWTDEKSISYLELDGIARKYAVTNNCRNICVDYYEEFNNSVKRARYKKPVTEVVTQQPSVFATFKDYKTNTTSKPVLSSYSNSFRHLGSIQDFEESQMESTNEDNIESTSYSDWVNTKKVK